MKQNRKILWVGSAAPVSLLIMLALPWPAVGGTPFKWTERRAAREILQNRPRWETLIESILLFVYNEGKTGTE